MSPGMTVSAAGGVSGTTPTLNTTRRSYIRL